MQVKPVGSYHTLFILSAAEANLFGIPTDCACAILLRTHLPIHPKTVSCGHRYHVRTQPQIVHFADCHALLQFLSILHRQQIPLSCQLYQLNRKQQLVLFPTCRQLSRLRQLLPEYHGILLAHSQLCLAYLQEHGTLLSANPLEELESIPFP